MSTVIGDLWALCWRESGDKTLHATPLVEVLRKNSKTCVVGSGDVLVIVGVHESLEAALQYKRYLRALRKDEAHEGTCEGDQVPGVRMQVQGETPSEPVPGVRNGELAGSLECRAPRE
jgi:hypothetical protein